MLKILLTKADDGNRILIDVATIESMESCINVAGTGGTVIYATSGSYHVSQEMASILAALGNNGVAIIAL